MEEEYKMGDAVLGRTTQEKDLGVTFSADMKVSEQCRIAASKGNQILRLIRRTIMYKEKQLIVPLYKALVRLHLEYCIQAWRPYRKKDIDKLERIQRRATKMIPELRDLSYESRLLQCGLTTLETRRLRGDQIEVFKIVNGYEDVDRNMFFNFKEGSRTRGHKAALVKEQCKLDMRKYSFSQRVINEWNKLPNDCFNASSVNMLKNRIDRYLIRLRIDEKIVGLSISQWLPCPLAIWNLFGMAILLNLIKSLMLLCSLGYTRNVLVGDTGDVKMKSETSWKDCTINL